MNIPAHGIRAPCTSSRALLMTRVFSDAIRIARRRIFASTALIAILGAASFACTEGRELTAVGGEPHAVRLAIVPRFHLFGSSSQMAPINLAHLTVVKASNHDTIAGPITIALDPSNSEWHLPVDFNV